MINTGTKLGSIIRASTANRIASKSTKRKINVRTVGFAVNGLPSLWEWYRRPLNSTGYDEACRHDEACGKVRVVGGWWVGCRRYLCE